MPEAGEVKECSVLHVDGSSNIARFGAGMVLTSPNGVVAEYALNFIFKALNNEAEYEALIMRIKIFKDHKVRYLKVYSNSQLVIKQVHGKYEAQEPNMITYLWKVKDLHPLSLPCKSSRSQGRKMLESTSYRNLC